ncbi:MAG: hypothetical protein ABIN48_15080 [Ginsengibacter sp.]
MKHVFPNPLLSKLSNSELRELSIEVKETLVNYTPANQAKKFTGVDLWKIQKQRKSFSRRALLRSY